MKPTSPVTWVRWRIVALLMAISCICQINRLSIRVAGDERIMAEFGLSPTEMGQVYSAFLFAYMLCMIPGGWLIDRLGPRRALLIVGLGSAIFSALTGLGGYGILAGGLVLPSFLVIRALLGACNAPLPPSTHRMVSFWLPLRQRGWGNGLLSAAAGMGIASAGVAFGLFIDWFDWRLAFLVMAGFTGVLSIVWYWYATDHPTQHRSVLPGELELIEDCEGVADPESARLKELARELTDQSALGDERVQIQDSPGKAVLAVPEPSTDCPEAAAANWLGLLRNRSLVLITLSYGAIGYFEYLFFYWMNYYFAKVLQLGQEESRFYASIPLLTMVVGMVSGGWLSDFMVRLLGYRRGRKVVPMAGMIASALLLAIGVNATQASWIVFWFSLALAAIGATEGPIWSTAVELGGRQGGAAGGVFNTGGNAGGILAPILTPWIAATFEQAPWVGDYFGNSWKLSLYFGSLVCMLGVVLWYWIDPAER
jgi:MFS family permease